MSNMDNQTELEALQTLLTRGVITQEQFNQLSVESLQTQQPHETQL
jgi:hypothetical protein